MYVIGTAGHVDHGKSTLVKALTGIDPDRWAEERRREMTIDLGFAWLTLPSGRNISIIDVPGHERFIKNMLAGVGGIDAALLVVAADEAMMPQTEEHLAILDLLGVTHGLVVLTKADLVDDEWLDLVRAEVRARLAGTSLAHAPQVAVSARTGAGMPELLAALDAQLDSIPARAAQHGAPRMSLDRAFTIGGFGTVVTGTLLDGPLAVGDEVELLPKGLRARVRGLQTHQQKVSQARPGTRVAVNLAGVSHHDLARGDMLALPGRVRASDLIDVQLQLVAGTRALRHNERLDVFVGAAEAACRVALLDADELAPGASGWAQLRLEQPIAVVRGDRYILRQPSPSQTLGGGRVLDAAPQRHRRFRSEVLAALEALARGRPADLFQRALDDGQPHSWAGLLQASGLSETLAREALDELLAGEQIVVLGQPANAGEHSAPATWLIASKGWAALHDKLEAALRVYHRRYPLRMGMPREELRSRLMLDTEAFDVVMAAASAAGLIAIQGVSIHLPQHTPELTPAQARAVQALLAAFRATPYSPPALDLDPEVAGWLTEQGALVRVAPEVAFLADTYAELVAWVRTTIGTGGSLSVAQFRDQFGSSRKYALALLEHLDERKITRRVGDARVLY